VKGSSEMRAHMEPVILRHDLSQLLPALGFFCDGHYYRLAQRAEYVLCFLFLDLCRFLCSLPKSCEDRKVHLSCQNNFLTFLGLLLRDFLGNIRDEASSVDMTAVPSWFQAGKTFLYPAPFPQAPPSCKWWN
jgi:hypothetical protein